MTDVVSPTGTIVAMALNKKVSNKENPDAPAKYFIRLRFDDAEHATFKKQITDINPRLIGGGPNSKTHIAGTFTVGASTEYAVPVTDSDGEEITTEDIPSFYAGSTGKAKMLMKVNDKNPKGAGLYLTAVALMELDLAEAPEGVLDRLREALNTTGTTT